MNNIVKAYWIIAGLITEFFGVALTTYLIILYIVPLTFFEFLVFGFSIGGLMLLSGFTVMLLNEGAK